MDGRGSLLGNYESHSWAKILELPSYNGSSQLDWLLEEQEIKYKTSWPLEKQTKPEHEKVIET